MIELEGNAQKKENELAELSHSTSELDSLGLKIVRVDNPELYESKIKPKILGVNGKTGVMEVTPEFFWTVWKEFETDETWTAWVCVDNRDRVQGVIVLQMFVHESEFFQWGPPLSKLSLTPGEDGAIKNVAELSVFCAKGCGRFLLKELEDYVRDHTNYDAIVLSSTPGAIQWYKSKDYKEVKAYRLEPNHSHRKSQLQAHRYRHRINDLALDTTLDPPSVMLYKLTSRLRLKTPKLSLKEMIDVKGHSSSSPSSSHGNHRTLSSTSFSTSPNLFKYEKREGKSERLLEPNEVVSSH